MFDVLFKTVNRWRSLKFAYIEGQPFQGYIIFAISKPGKDFTQTKPSRQKLIKLLEKKIRDGAYSKFLVLNISQVSPIPLKPNLAYCG